MDASKSYFHGDDVIWIELISKHPWRTFDPEKAKIFIIPAMVGFRTNQPRLSCGGKTQDRILDDMAKQLLTEPTFIKNQGIDHLIVSSHFKLRNNAKWRLMSENFLRVTRQIKFANFEILHNRNYNHKGSRIWPELWKCSLVVPYVDNSLLNRPEITNSQRQKILTYDAWKQRHYDLFFIGGLDGRTSYKARLDINQGLNSHNLFRDFKFIYAASKSKSLGKTTEAMKNPCNQTKCETTNCANCLATDSMKSKYVNYLVDSKFALVIHGDTPSTSRLYDAISSGAIPIIVSSDLYIEGLPFIDKVPFYDFCFFINESLNVEEIYQQIYKVVRETPEYILKYRFEKMVKHIDDVSWRSKTTRIVENILYDSLKVCRY